MPTFAKYAGLRFGDFRKIWPAISHRDTFNFNRLEQLNPNGYEFHHPIKRIEDLIELSGFHNIAKPVS